MNTRRGTENADAAAHDPPGARIGLRSESALARALAVQRDARLKGFDWDDPVDALGKVREEAEEVGALLALRNALPVADPGRCASGPPPEQSRSAGCCDALDEELGDLLFAVVNVVRLAGADPASALARATAKFEERFAEVGRLARLRDLPMPGTPLAELDRLWKEIKAEEESGSANNPGAAGGSEEAGGPGKAGTSAPP